MKALLAAGLVLLASVASGSSWKPHFDARLGIIQLHAATLGTGHTLLLGDSNTEGFWWTTVGGCHVINAGFGGARADDIAVRASGVAAVTQPAIAHLMVGTNDLLAGTGVGEFVVSLRATINALQGRGAKVVVWPIPPVSASLGRHTERLELNEAARVEASALGAYWDWWWPRQLGDDGGYARAGTLADDGIHLSASSQASRYYRIEQWRAHIYATTGVNGC